MRRWQFLPERYSALLCSVATPHAACRIVRGHPVDVLLHILAAFE